MEENQKELTNEQGVVAETPTPDITDAESKINQECAQIMINFMDAAQGAIDRYADGVNRLQALLDQTHREDILETIEDMKSCIGNLAEQWQDAQDWQNFYLGINTDINKDEVEVYGEPEADDEDEPKNNDTEE